MDYYQMLNEVRWRMTYIYQVALEDEVFNVEYLELQVLENSLIKLIKITKDK